MFKKRFLLKLGSALLIGLMLNINFTLIKADTITTAFNQMSRVSSNAIANHNIYFVLPNGLSAGQSINISFPSEFSFGSLFDYTDITLAEGSLLDCKTSTFTNKTLSSSPSGSTWGAIYSALTITITSGTDTLTSNKCIRVQLNSNGTNHNINNPNVISNTVFNITLSTPQNSGELAVIILGDSSAVNIDTVQLNANVSNTILMGIDTVNDNCNNNTQTLPENQSISFGQLFPGIAKYSTTDIPFICIEAATNSNSGLKILVQSSRNNDVGGMVGSTGTIESVTGDLNLAGITQGYGLRIASIGTPTIGSFLINSPFNSLTTGDVGQVSGSLGSATLLISSLGTVRSDSLSRIAVEVGVKSSTLTPAESYSDTLTFTAFTNL